MDEKNSKQVVVTKSVKKLDQSLYELVKGINILDAVSPLNYKEERQAFFDSQYSKEPEFVYQPHTIDAFALKRKLFNLKVEKIEDVDLRQLYTDVIDSYVDKIDQFKSIGSPEFLYDSLRYYGEPSEKDLRNAHFILHLPEHREKQDEKLYRAADIEKLMREFAEKQQYDYQLKIDDSMIANAVVSGITVKINGSAEIAETDAIALAHHELGVHLATTLNGRSQPLRILSMGCPLNTMTQEGMAILSEYLAGCMTVKRLKLLALRVLSVNSMIKEKSFRDTFLMLKEEYKIKDLQAFTITSRVFRGGGFTKDYLYLRGFHEMLNAYENETDFNHLLAGKTAIDYLPLVVKLIDKGILLPPKNITPSFAEPIKNDSISQFIAHAIK